MIGAMLFVAAALAPPGLDSRHIPMGSPLGSMPIIAAPGESPRVLAAPMTEAQWLSARRAAIARSMRDPRMRAIARRLAENERTESGRDSAPGRP